MQTYSGYSYGYQQFQGVDYQAMIYQQQMQMNYRLQAAQSRMGAVRDSEQHYNRVARGAQVGEEMVLDEAFDGSLNRDEFVALSATQNDFNRVLAKYSSDGILDQGERMDLARRRNAFRQQLADYRENDCRPVTREGKKGLAGREDKQSAMLYDLIASGKISPEQAQNLRDQMRIASQHEGVEEANAPWALDERVESANERRDEIEWELHSAGRAKGSRKNRRNV